jgi:uncharacterized protein
MVKRFFRYTFGIFFLILGVIGLFLPILQGILFIIVGLLILAPESKKIQRLLDKLRQKYPGVFEAAERTQEKILQKFQKKHSSAKDKS